MARIIATLMFIIGFAFAGMLPASAQDLGLRLPGAEALQGRNATGGAQTLEDILARQRAAGAPTTARDDAMGNAEALVGPLETRGGASDSEIWSMLRHGTADTIVSTRQARDAILVQDSGMEWLKFRAGPLREYGGYLLLGTLGLLALFYLIRGRVRIEGAKRRSHLAFRRDRALRSLADRRFVHSPRADRIDYALWPRRDYPVVRA